MRSPLLALTNNSHSTLAGRADAVMTFADIRVPDCRCCGVVVDNADPKLATNVAEVQARGGRIISIGSASSTRPAMGSPVAPWGPLEATIPLQILARTLALALGHDVDKPRNLAKSVTVE
jgi:hypothetical protein